MDATLPKIRTAQVLVSVIPEQVCHVSTYESRRVVACCLEAIDHRRRTGEQMLNAVASARSCFLRSLALRYVAPRANDFNRLVSLVADESLLIIHPAVCSVFFAKPVFDAMAASLEQLDGLGFNGSEVVRVYALAPEVGVLQVFSGLIA